MATSKNEAGRKGGLASAKAKLAKVARGLKPGDSVTITNRLYAVVSKRGKLGENYGCPEIYSTRAGAIDGAKTYDKQTPVGAPHRVIRLADITGIVQ